MAYLGNSPVLSQQEYRNIDNISGSFNGVTTSFPLLVNGVAPVPAPQSSNQCLISVNGVVQKPDDTGASGFRLSGGNIVFSAAPTGGQSFFGVILAGADYIYAGSNFPDGTVSAPSITFAQDLDTGFYRSGAGEVKFTANGTNVVTLSANNLTAPSFIPTSSTVPSNGVYLPSSNNVAISTNGTGRLFINSAGNAVIGSNTVQAFTGYTSLTLDNATNGGVLCLNKNALNIGNISATGDALTIDAAGGGTSPIVFRTGAATTERLRITSTGALNFVGAGTAGSTQAVSFNGSAPVNSLVIDSSGRVGLGTSSPSNQLDIASSVGGIIRLTDTDGGYALLEGGAGDLALQADVGNTQASSKIQFFIDNSEKARLTSDGRLGIGTTGPLTIFDVKPSTNRHIVFSASSTYANNAVVGVDDAGAEIALGIGGSPIQFITGLNERARIDSSGRFGIGTTVVNSLFEVRGASDGQNIVHISNNAGSSDGGATNVIRITCNGNTNWANARYDAYGHFWNVNSSEAMRIDGSKRLLVGTSSSTGIGTNPQLIIQGSSASNAAIFLGRNTDASTITAGNTLGFIELGSRDGGIGAKITAEADATWSSTSDCPSRLMFSTTADGASSPTERMRITNGGVTKLTSTGSYYGASSAYHESRIATANNVVHLFNHNASSGSIYGIQITYDQQNKSASTADEYIYCNDSGAVRMSVRGNGGIANYSGNNVNLCDEREKKNIVNLDSTWDCLKHWELKKFHYNEDADADDLRYGVIAQQVADYCPEVISEWVKQKAEPAKLDEEGNEIEPAKEEVVRMAVKEQQMMWMAIKALQEAQLRIETLEAEVAALKGA
jgi:hypothetical protein